MSNKYSCAMCGKPTPERQLWLWEECTACAGGYVPCAICGDGYLAKIHAELHDLDIPIQEKLFVRTSWEE